MNRVTIVHFIAACLAVVLSLPLIAGEKQYWEQGDFRGGLNTATVGDIAPNQVSVLSNFLFDNDGLRVRSGYVALSNQFSTFPIDYLAVYRNGLVSNKLLVFIQGVLYAVNLDNPSDTSWIANPIYYSAVVSGTGITGTAGSLFVSKNDSTSTWESYYGTTIQFDSSTMTPVKMTIDYVLTDTLLKLTAALTAPVTGWTWSILQDAGKVVMGESFIDSFYFITNSGRNYYNDSSVLGANTQAVYRAAVDWASTSTTFIGEHTTGQYHLMKDAWSKYRWGSMVNGDSASFFDAVKRGGAMIKASLRGFGEDSSVIVNRRVYASFAVYSVSGITIYTTGSAFTPEADTLTPFISVINPLPTDVGSFTVYADSLIARTKIYGNDSCRYTIFVDDSCAAAWDSTKFISGDWFAARTFFVPNEHYSSVIGGYEDDSGRVYIAHRLLFYDKAWNDTIQTNVAVKFYRRIPKAPAVEAYRAATFWNDRWCTVSESTSSQIDISNLFAPMTASGYYVQVNPDDGEPITFLKPMYGNLIIGKQSSIWKLSGIGGLDAFASLTKVVDGQSFISSRSIVSHQGLLFGLGTDGFYVFDFNSMVKISNQIDDLLRDSLNWNYASGVTAAYFDNHYWVSYPSRTSIKNDRTLVYSPTYQAWGKISGMPFSSITVDNTDSDTSGVYFGDPTNAIVNVYGWVYDNSSLITAEMQTGWMNLGTSWHEKIVDRVFTLGSRYTGGQLTMNVYKDGSSVAYATNNYTGLTARDKRMMWLTPDLSRGFEHKIGIILYNSVGTGYPKLGKLGMEYEVESVDY